MNVSEEQVTESGIDALTDRELKDELWRRQENRKVPADAPYMVSPSRDLSCRQLHGRQDLDGTEVERYYVENGNWEGSRCGDWWVIHAPHGDSMHEVTDWEELVYVKIANRFKSPEVEKWAMECDINIYFYKFNKVQLRAIDATAFKLKWG